MTVEHWLITEALSRVALFFVYFLLPIAFFFFLQKSTDSELMWFGYLVGYFSWLRTELTRTKVVLSSTVSCRDFSKY